MDCKLQSRLDLLHTNLEEMVHKKQWQQKHFYKGNRNRMIDLYNGASLCAQLQQRSSLGRWCSSVETSPLSYTIKLEDGKAVKQHLDQIRKTLQSETHERGKPEDLLVKPIHPQDKPCSRAMVPVSPGQPEEWHVTPDLPEQQQDGVDKQIEPLPEISTEPENLETHVQPTVASNLGANKGVTPVAVPAKKKGTRQTEFLVD